MRDGDQGPRRGVTVFFVAGEVSGDIYGADLVRALRRQRPDLSLVGVGGPRMAAAGAEILLDSSEWGIVGYIEAIPHIPAFWKRLGRVRGMILGRAPAALVLIDAPGFNLPLARGLPKRPPTAYFMPPMVSTRRGRRAERIARLSLHLLPAFPFEAEAYRAAGADAVFVGHPAVDRVTAGPREVVRQRLNLPREAPVVAVLPGSRRQEILHHMPVIVDALNHVRRRFPDVQVVLPVASPRFAPLIEREVARGSVPVRLIEGGGLAAYDALGASDFAVVASGTATLEAMCLGVPMVIIYRMSALGFWVLRRIAAVSWAGLPNLLAGEEVVPELLQHGCTAGMVAATVIDWLGDERRRAETRRRLLDLRGRLGPGGAAERAADEILSRCLPRGA